MRSTLVTRGVLALALVAAAVFAVGVGAGGADAQSAAVSPGGPYIGDAGVPIPFQATSTIGAIQSAQWSFGDGTSANGAGVQKTFRIPGVYTVTLTAMVNGQTYQASTTATVTAMAAAGQLLGGGVFVPQTVGTVAVLPAFPFFRPCVGGRVINGMIFC